MNYGYDTKKSPKGDFLVKQYKEANLSYSESLEPNHDKFNIFLLFSWVPNWGCQVRSGFWQTAWPDRGYPNWSEKIKKYIMNLLMRRSG